MWWVICSPNQSYVGNNGEMVPWIQQARVFNDREEAVGEAKNISARAGSQLNVVSLAEAAYLDAKHVRKTHRKDKGTRKAPCSYLPFAGVFIPCSDADENSFGFEQMRSLYLAVRGAEVVGIIGEADGQVISIGGIDYEVFKEEYSVVPTCPDCGEPFVPDGDEDEGDDDEEDDSGPFDPGDFR